MSAHCAWVYNVHRDLVIDLAPYLLTAKIFLYRGAASV